MKKLAYILGIALVVSLSLAGCKKEQEGTSQMKVKMVDAPGDFQEVNIEVLGVEVHSNTQGWVSLPTNQGVYDLLTLQDSVSAVLVNAGQFPSGQISQMRLILGSNNYVLVDDTIHPLSTPSAQQSGLKINLNYTFEPNEIYELLFDFDAQQSIVLQGNGGYTLKPVLKVLSIIPL